jgi:AcrR family transcriptional regulator
MQKGLQLSQPRRHHHLSHESIARAALDLVDREGKDALTIRGLAKVLNVGPTNLYTYYRDREEIVLGVLALLHAEIDLPDEPDLSWEDCALAIGKSLRAMALRHPRAFPLVAGAAFDDWPLIEYGRRVDALLLRHGAPEALLPRLASMLDSFGTGFLLLETQAITKKPDRSWNPFTGPKAEQAAAAFTVTDSEAAFEEGSRCIIAGFKVLHGLGESQPGHDGP